MSKKLCKFGSLFLLVLICVTLFTTNNSYAKLKHKKKINKVTLSIKGSIEPDTEFGSEDIDVTSDDTKFEIKDVEFLNTGFRWTYDDVPELKIELQAKEQYYFNVTSSSEVNLPSNVKFKSARRTDNATILTVVVNLPALNSQVREIENLNILDNGILSWNPTEGVGYYEVKFKRNNSLLGGVQKVYSNELNVADYMTREGNYYFFVRGISSKNAQVASEWYRSDEIYLNSTDAKKFKELKEKKDSLGHFVEQNGNWYYIDASGNHIVNNWKKIKDQWYYFDFNGIMVKGWYQLGDEWYYLDKNDGYMWKNTITPDGYSVSISGAWIKDAPVSVNNK